MTSKIGRMRGPAEDEATGMEPRILRERISDEGAQSLFAGAPEMVKVVVDLSRKIIAVGGDLHADGEQLLLDDGSRQEDLWGANIYPEKRGEAQMEFTSLINIRPRQGNRSQTIQDHGIQAAVSGVIRALLPLP